MTHDGAERGDTPGAGSAAARRWPLVLRLLTALVVAGLALGGAVQTVRVDRLSGALTAAHATATAQARSMAIARSAAVATARAAVRATTVAEARRHPPVMLALPPAVAGPACTAVARAQALVRVVLRGVTGAGTVVDAAARALQTACAADTGQR